MLEASAHAMVARILQYRRVSNQHTVHSEFEQCYTSIISQSWKKRKKTQHTHIYGFSKSNARGKFIATNNYIKKEGRFQINNLASHLKELEWEEQFKPKPSRRRK